MKEAAQGLAAGGLPHLLRSGDHPDADPGRSAPLASLKHALAQREFRLAYQPIIDLRSRQPVGVEALIRWPRTGIGPDVFIPAAEQSGLIRDITRQVCRLAAEDLVAHRIPAPVQLSINLSAADVETMDTLPLLSALAKVLGGGAALNVELTERCLLAPERCGPVLQAIRAQGIQVHLDDFGIGYANFLSLIELALDGIKIDRSLIRHIEASSAARLVIQHLVRLAGTLGLSVTAEGIETESQAQILESLGIRLAQGWLFGRPRLIEDYPRCDQRPIKKSN